jgi:pimeloyl-ACP methyl ester carboxylesterase
MTRKLCTGLALLVALRAAPVTALSEVICTGDCNYDHTTGIDELLTGVTIALGQASIDTCRGFDRNGDGTASVDELLSGVRNALDGCPRARLERTACDFTRPAETEPAGPECGFAIVQEDRAATSGRTVRIPYVVCKAPGPRRDPIVLFEGGPGAPSDRVEAPACDAPGSNPFQARFDIVRFDQRGTGRSLPSLDCPEWREALSTFLSAAQGIGEDAAALRVAMHACHDRLANEGVNFGAYTSSASAHDVQDLMLALGYEQWKMYGASYGTRVELTALRDTPEHIRSALLDSVVPVQVNHDANWAANLQRSLDTLFAACAADAACDAAFPALEQTLFDLVAELNARPITLSPVNPVTGQPMTVVMTGDRLLLGLAQTVTDTTLIPFLPLVITTTAQGNYGLITTAAAQAVTARSQIAYGVYHSVLCNEEDPFITPEIVAAATAGVRDETKRVMLAFFTQLNLDVCAFWGSPPPPAIENEPVVSDVPVLVLAGEYDPSTPPAYGRLAAETLSHSSLFEFPGFGHGVFSPGCAANLSFAFQADPSQPVDGSCVEAIPPPHFVGS